MKQFTCAHAKSMRAKRRNEAISPRVGRKNDHKINSLIGHYTKFPAIQLRALLGDAASLMHEENTLTHMG